MTMPGILGRIGPIAAFAVIGLTSCFSLGRNPPIERQYVLGGSLGPVAGPSSSGKLAGKSVGIRRLQLAPYLATPFILVRRGPNQITHSEFNRWGEDLDAGVPRAVSGYLRALAPFRTVAVAPWPLQEKFDYLVQLRVLHFEGLAPEEPATGGGEVQVQAAWELINPQNGTVLARGTTDYRQPGWRVDDYAGLVKLLDTGLGELSRELVASLESLIVP
jgi:uncharacterized lipoprotein YmbA